MTIEWISAAQALKIVETMFPADRAKVAIWTAARGGLMKTRAATLLLDDKPKPSASIPPTFWSGLGLDNCTADWQTGYFAALVANNRWQAFRVEFSFADIMELVPSDRRPQALIVSSVIGDPAYVSAVVARRLIYNEAGINPARAGSFIIDKCRMGLIGARSVQARLAVGSKPDEWSARYREWDIPLWFWRDFTEADSSSQDWELGQFAGRGFHDGKPLWVTLRGVAFAKAGLSLFVPSLRETAEHHAEGQEAASALPRLPDGKLTQWWEAKAAVRDSLSLDELLTLARAAHPENHVARDRIRDLAGGRKRGPKAFGGNPSAK